ncbi:MAG TPA: KpsF/GutQ family sugar-phosphate isomerase [Burkholderiaceae bacterium]|nr:KpsF/GutQ family sugar-phosphate isomerase [Burkholderiaceae bacterium]
MGSVNRVLSQTSNQRGLLQAARDVLAIEIEGLSALDQRLSTPQAAAAFERATALILACKGRVVVSGIGKSGHIGRKIASTLASTGTPAFFVHPAEALHGDLGMVTAHDVFIALSNSGEAQELLAIVPILKRQGAALIAMTGNDDSRLAEHADVHLNAGVAREACPLNLAPTASTTAQLALGDALAVALLEARGFGREDFARSHPGGSLGRRLLTHVRDVMRTGDAIPRVTQDATLPQAILEISQKRMGMTAVLANDGAIAGIFTDGDLRRLLERTLDLSNITLGDVITRTPLSIGSDALAAEAADLLDRHRRNQLLVVDDGQLVGALHVHDLMAAKVI